MEFIIDTINLEEIKDAVEHMPIAGVTSNPSIDHYQRSTSYS